MVVCGGRVGVEPCVMWRVMWASLALLPVARSQGREWAEVELESEGSWAPEPEPMVGFNCAAVLGHKDCQRVYAPDHANFTDLSACEQSGCDSCREKTCNAHGACTGKVDGPKCTCEANYYPSSSCSIWKRPTATMCRVI